MEKSKHKRRIAVLRGGPSSEYESSMKTGAMVLKVLEEAPGIHPFDVTISRDHEWILEGRVRKPEHILQTMDGAFLALRGQYGEDGEVQRLLNRYGVKYTGSGVYGSGVSLHKALTKDHLRTHGVPMLPHMYVRKESVNNLHGLVDSIADLFGPEYIVKPTYGSAGNGIEEAQNKTELLSVMRKALEASESVLVEKKVNGRTASSGVIEDMRGSSYYQLPVVEHTDTGGIAPGRFTEEQKRIIHEISLTAHTALGLSDMSMSDFLVAENGEVHFLEINTLPALHDDAPLPVSLEAVGIPFSDYVTHLINRTR